MSRKKAPEGGGGAGRDESWRGERSRLFVTWGLPLLFWSFFAVFAATHTYVAMLAHHHSFLRILLFEWIVCSYWAASAPLIGALTRRLPLVPFRLPAAGVHLLTGLLFSTGCVIWSLAAVVAVQPYDAMGVQALDFDLFVKAIRGRVPFEVLVYCGTVAAFYGFEFYGRYRERATRAAELEGELVKARLDALSMQLQPHFLFNALHTVSGLIRTGEPQKAITTIAGLSDMLRYALSDAGEHEATVGEELEVVRHYLHIEELRYGARFEVRFDVDEATLRARVPRLLLQPLVENAVRHGLEKKPGQGHISIVATDAGPEARITVEDDGVGMDPQQVRSSLAGRTSGIGLANVDERLRTVFGADFGLVVETAPGAGTKVSLRIPKYRSGVRAS
jgi:hypothetical protein